MPDIRGTAVGMLLATALLAPLAPPAAAASPSPSPSPTASPAATPSPIPSTDAAAKEVQRQQRALAAETATLATAAQKATATLQTFQLRQREAAKAKREAATQLARSQAATIALTAARQQLQAYAGSLYRTGMLGSPLLILSASLNASGPVQFLNGLRVAQHVASARGEVVSGLAAAEQEQKSASADATAAAALQLITAARAKAADSAARRVVAAYTAQVAARRVVLQRTTTILVLAQQRDRNVADAQRIATGRGWTPSPPCAGKDISTYDNGRIPLDALCPLQFATGRHLRADAAFAFNAMALEYAGIFGTPLCVTDSYRSYDAQVVVAAEKPALAAEPGQSNHGWGLAADLCDGIEAFGTPTHQWMVDNAPRFGWFHPAWAEIDGTKPEPWHWEFAG